MQESVGGRKEAIALQGDHSCTFSASSFDPQLMMVEYKCYYEYDDRDDHDDAHWTVDDRNDDELALLVIRLLASCDPVAGNRDM